jgi:conjugal transfer pilus assembly protein TraI
MLEALVRRASALVIERDLADNPDRHRAVLGLHLERHLVDAMRRLVAEGKWIANAPASHLWYAEDGVFLLWPEAAADMIALLELDRLPGVPKAHERIAELLAGAWAIEAQPDGALSWDIFLPNAPTSSSAVKLASPALLASAASAAPTPLPRRLRERTPPENPAPAPTQAELTLSASGRESIETSTEVHAPASGVARSPVTLNAPARLNPAVRDALRQILATIDSPGQPLAAFVIELGVFIPLKEFEQRSVDPALAVRALSEAGMLASDPKRPGSKTHSCNFHDEPALGVVVDFRHVSGLQLGARAQASRELDPNEP